MKKILLSVCALLFAIAGWAQQYSMPQGTTNNVYPFGSTLSNKVQWLYRPSNFSTAPPSGNITKLYFKTWNGAASYSATYSNFTIRAINTPLTAFANTTFVPGATVVFTGNPVVVPTTGQFTWFSFTLQTPFAYTGGNFILEIEQNGLVNGITANCTNAAGNQRIYGNYGGTTGIGFDNSIGDLGFDMCASCTPPTNIVKNNLTRYSVDLTWDPVQCASGYEYLIDQTPGNPTSWGYATVAAPALSLNSLPDGTCYYIHIKTQCGGPTDTSAWVLDSFCTVADCKIPVVTIDNVTATTAVARWDAVPGVLSYEYSVGTTPDTPTQGHTTTYTSVKLQGLTPNKPLYFFLKAKCTPTPASPWGTSPFHTSAGTGIEDVGMNDALSVYAYPNPAKEQVTIHLDGKTGVNPMLRLTDLTGKVIATQKVSSDENIFNISGLAPGLYYVEYSDEGMKKVLKINKL